MMKRYPWEHKEKKEIVFFPDPPDVRTGDVLEIGPGRGDVLFGIATDLPDKRIIGIELGQRRFDKLVERTQKRGLTNIQLILADARIALLKYFQEALFEKIYVLFPDPWPKQRHKHMRLLNREFITLLTERLVPKGNLYFATDVDWYAAEMVANAESCTSLTNQGNPYTTAEALYKYTPTFFEQKWRFEKRDIYYMHFVKSN